MPAVHLTDADDRFLQEDRHDPDYQSLCDAFEENYRIIERRRPDIAQDLEDSFWNKRYQCWDITERDLYDIWDIEWNTRPRPKKITLEYILRYRVPVHLALRFVFMAGVLAFVIKIRFFSS